MPNSGDNPDSAELKAGHLPAVKVGNMRVTQRKFSTSSTTSDKNAEEDTGTVPDACSFAPKTVVDNKAATSGVPEEVVQKNDKSAITQEAVKHIHDKPQVTHDYRGHNTKPNMIQQPKK